MLDIMEFKMKLYEILDTKMDIEYKVDQKHFNAYTSIKDTEYSVECEQYKLYNDMYNQLKELGANIKIDDSIWYIAFTGPNYYRLTNANIPLTVFSFVKQSLLEFIKRYKPKYICFDTDSDIKKRIYINLISKTIKNKKVYSIPDEFNDNDCTFVEI